MRIRSDRTPDPLKDRFDLDDLPWIAPWVAEQIEEVGRDTIRASLSTRGIDPDRPQMMST